MYEANWRRHFSRYDGVFFFLFSDRCFILPFTNRESGTGKAHGEADVRISKQARTLGSLNEGVGMIATHDWCIP